MMIFADGASATDADLLPYEVYNTSVKDLFDAILTDDHNGRLSYYFEKLPEQLRADISSVAGQLFLQPSDLEKYEQYIWFSSAGVRMHTHVDADHNFFLQVSGRKRWTLYPSSEQAELHPFPRTHPLWHKAQRLPDEAPEGVATTRFPDRTSPATPFVVEVGPGEVLYVPPYLLWTILAYNSIV